MEPNLEITIRILNSKLAEQQLESAQWQSVANDLQQEKEHYKQECERLTGELDQLTKPTEDAGKYHEVTE